MYDENGVKVPKEDLEELIRGYWGNIYEINENKICAVWNEGIKGE